MIHSLSKRMIGCAAAVLWALPVWAWAAGDDSSVRPDGRYIGYDNNVKLSDSAGGYSLHWILIFFLGLIVVAAVFKDPKRSHLD
jgi:hypothetical protein